MEIGRYLHEVEHIQSNLVHKRFSIKLESVKKIFLFKEIENIHVTI